MNRTASEATGLAHQWLRSPKPRRRPRLRLVCFPHAGGSARFFYPWLRHLPTGVELLAAQYPGRDDRIDEPVIDRMDRLADPLGEAVAEVADVPLVLFGHSMGASVAFEVARRLEGRSVSLVRHLFVSARPAPFSADPALRPVRDDDTLVRELARLGGTDTTLFDDPDVRAALLPAVRSDYRLIESYRYRPGPPLSCPVTAVVGSHDPEVPHGFAEAWNAATTGTFTMRVIPGGHFYLIERRPALIAYLLTALGLRGSHRDGPASTP
ncbi:thioesterase II family protein [Streptomyces sp. YU58]|uniref:thioesterase II family protein n=1 Tax=Streptomyces sp. SX92 TaxID=3158972 RepID=UPI0027B964DC|nr:alpha/beta fold hydrolase [Streptomyces coralus]WLW50147.1 alpha/beta fold hydrolase [Streptomyces coralus]